MVGAANRVHARSEACTRCCMRRAQVFNSRSGQRKGRAITRHIAFPNMSNGQRPPRPFFADPLQRLSQPLWTAPPSHSFPSLSQPRAPFNYSAPLGGGGGSQPTPPPLTPSPPLPPKDRTKFSSGPLANQKFSLVPLAPLKTQHRWGATGGGGARGAGPPPPPKNPPETQPCPAPLPPPQPQPCTPPVPSSAQLTTGAARARPPRCRCCRPPTPRCPWG